MRTFAEIAFQLKQHLYEMSMAFFYKDKRIDVCAWVETPMTVDNRYFKYYNCSTIPSATHVARIRLDKPEYVGGLHRENGKKKWILTKREKEELIEILKGQSTDQPGYTRWQEVLMTYNRDNFNLSFSDSKSNDFSKAQKDPKMSKYLKPFPIDYPMPDYLNLKD